MRLIDADALIAEYDRVHVGAPGGARKLMVDAPTVEAEPIRYAYWMPNDANAVELGAYQAMLYLYARFRTGHIDRDHAREDKHEILKAYNTGIMRYRMYEALERRYKSIQPLLLEIEQSDNDLCRKLVRIMDGRDGITKEEKR